MFSDDRSVNFDRVSRSITHHRIPRRMIFSKPCALIVSLAAMVTVGCPSVAELDSTTSRVQWLSAEPIDEAGSIADAVEIITGGGDIVSLRGRIGVGDVPAFEPERAAFLMSEIIDDPNAGSGHDASTCPFCKRKLERAPKAYVVLVKEDGSDVPRRADELLSLDRDEIVQVRGKATFDETINTIKIEADAIYKERASTESP